ncbi:hypothetical protein FHR70_003701 [Microvirga lupini]|uniref:Uncharacterized protein n=1 Tax=Microvirga lupini TaxID=420324 RepID=A0A7W4YXK5_9HYPH|nr:hypothetical protein [Microvirga lupini]
MTSPMKEQSMSEQEGMVEPDFLSQSGETTTPQERREWFKARAQEAETRGATWHRFSHHEDVELILYEGWKERPKDEGPVRWQFVLIPTEGSKP